MVHVVSFSVPCNANQSMNGIFSTLRVKLHFLSYSRMPVDQERNCWPSYTFLFLFSVTVNIKKSFKEQT